MCVAAQYDVPRHDQLSTPNNDDSYGDDLSSDADFNISVYTKKVEPKIKRTGSILTEIKVRLASDKARKCGIFSPFNASWDFITETIAKSLKLSSPSLIRGVILLDGAGKPCSPRISDSAQFWEIFASTYDDDGDNTVFEILDSPDAIMQSERLMASSPARKSVSMSVPVPSDAENVTGTTASSNVIAPSATAASVATPKAVESPLRVSAATTATPSRRPTASEMIRSPPAAVSLSGSPAPALTTPVRTKSTGK